nr:uncharacterized protein LOC105341788 [Crassostrea gigas]
MEFPVEGNYTPNFTESECSIRIPGIAWNGESPRSFRETPRITSPNKDSRDGRVQAFSAQRTSDTPRPTEELPSVESIMERVCSQMCNDLRRSGVLKDEVVDIVAARVYSELSSRCIRRSTDPDESVPASIASGRSSVNNGSRTGQNKRCKSSNDDRYSVVSRAAQGRSVVKTANSLKTKDEKSRNSSKSSHVRSSRADSAQSELATTSRSLVSRNLTRSRTPTRGQHGTPANTTSSRGSVLELSVDQNSYTPLPFIRQISSSGKQSIQSTPRSTEGRSSGNVQDRSKSSQSGSKQDNKTALLSPSKIPRRIESSTFLGRESEPSRSSASHILVPVRTRTPRDKDVAQITRNEDKIGQASSPTVYSTKNSPNSLKGAHFGDQVNRCKSVGNEINQDEWEMCYSSQVSSTMLGVGLSTPSSNEDENNEKRIFDTKDRAPKLVSKMPCLSQTSMKVSSSRSSKIPIRSVTPEVTKPANAKAKDNAKKMSKEKYENPNTRVNECAKNVSRRENKTPSGIFNKVKNKASVPKTGHKTEENTFKNALERRKAYETKRKLQREGGLAAKTAKKTETDSKKQTNNTGDNDEPKTKAGKGPIVSTEVPIIEKKPCHNEDNFTYEDDFEPVEEEERNVHHESAVDTGIVDRALAKSPESPIQMEPVNHDIKQESPVRYGHTEEDPDNTPRLNFMTDKEIHAWQVDIVHGRFAADIGRVNPSSTRSDVDFGYLGHPNSNDLVQSQSGYHPGYCLTHMHPSIAHVYDNLDQIPEYKRMKEKTRRKAGKMVSHADENEHVRRRPSNAKKKTTVGYVPGYGAVRVMKENVGQAYPGGKKRTSSNTSFPVIDNRPKPGRTQRPVVGYVPGYGPVRGPPVPLFPEVPSERVVLPPLDFGQACSCNGDVKRSKKGRDKICWRIVLKPSRSILMWTRKRQEDSNASMLGIDKE